MSAEFQKKPLESFVRDGFRVFANVGINCFLDNLVGFEEKVFLAAKVRFIGQSMQLKEWNNVSYEGHCFPTPSPCGPHCSRHRNHTNRTHTIVVYANNENC